MGAIVAAVIIILVVAILFSSIKMIQQGEAAKLVKVMSEVLRDEDVEAVLNSTIIKRLAEPEWGPPIGRLVKTLLQEQRQLPLINLLAELKARLGLSYLIVAHDLAVGQVRAEVTAVRVEHVRRAAGVDDRGHGADGVRPDPRVRTD